MVIGKVFTLDELMDEGYEAVFVASEQVFPALWD